MRTRSTTTSTSTPGRLPELCMGACALALAGCTVTTSYLATPAQLTQAAQVPAAVAATTALPVIREVGKARTQQPVFVRADVLQQAQPEPGSAPPRVLSRRYSPMVTAGAVLTVIGSVISVAASIAFVVVGDNDNRLYSGAVALSAEPLMILGTVLWIRGINHPPQEVAAGRPGVHYLPAEVPPPAAAPAPPPALSLRF